MRVRISCLFIATMLVMLVSCKVIIEPSLQNREVRLLAPVDQYQTTIYYIGFWWDEVEDALSYKLQIVGGTFNSPGNLVVDTLLKVNKFALNLVPGAYQWRIQAINGSSQSPFGGPRSFTIYPSTIKQQSVQLSSPANTFITNQPTMAFQWGNMFGATKYHIQIDTNNFVNEQAIAFDLTVPGQQLSYNFPKEQSYQWRVRAENDTAVSRWSIVSQLLFDRTPPGKIQLNAPSDGETVGRPVTLTWTIPQTAIKYKLYVLREDSVSAYNGTFPLVLNSNSYSFDLGNAGDKIYWRVAAIDAAGNEGPLSQLRNFVLR